MGNSLKELLLQEMNLDDLNRKVWQAEVKANKLKKQVGKQLINWSFCMSLQWIGKYTREHKDTG